MGESRICKGQNNKTSHATHKHYININTRRAIGKYGEVILAIEIMAINKIPFMITTSRNIHFGTAELICDKAKKTLMSYIQQVVRAYHARGFRVCKILVDGGFECIRNNLVDLWHNTKCRIQEQTCPRSREIYKDHHRKCQGHSKCTTIQNPPRLIAEMVYNAVFWLNTFPHKYGIHTTISPRTLIMGLAIDYHKHCKLAFRTYVQVHEESDSTLKPRTSGAIALRTMGYEQGGHYFLSLHSGKRLNRYSWTELPMPNEVIAQVHCLATKAENYNGIIFTDTNGNVLSEQFNKDMDGMINVPENQHTDHIQGNTSNYEENDDTDNVNDGNDGNKVMSQQSESDGNSRNKDQLPYNNEMPNEDMNELPNDELLNEGGEEINTEETYEDPITIDNVNIMTEMNMLQLAIPRRRTKYDKPSAYSWLQPERAPN